MVEKQNNPPLYTVRPINIYTGSKGEEACPQFHPLVGPETLGRNAIGRRKNLPTYQVLVVPTPPRRK